MSPLSASATARRDSTGSAKSKNPMRLVLSLILASVFCLAGESSLIDAIRDQDRNAIDALIQKHAGVNAAQPDGSTPLAWAAYEDDAQTVAMLLKAGAKVNVADEYGETPLTLACAVGNVPIVENLLSAGADVRMARENGETALMIAAGLGNARLVRMLIEHGSDVNAVESRKGQDALIWAAANGNAEVVDILLHASANPNLASKTGFTPLMFAAAQGDTRIVTRLLSAGAKINYTAPDGTNALRVALRSRKTGAVKALLLRGGNVFTARDLIASGLMHKWNQWGDTEAMKRFRTRLPSLEIGSAVLGFVLEVLLILLNTLNKSTRTVGLVLLSFSVLLTLPLGLGDPFVVEPPSSRGWWTREIIPVALAIFYWAAALWIWRNRSHRSSPAVIESDLEPVKR
jgi:ankyrin repeat protein